MDKFGKLADEIRNREGLRYDLDLRTRVMDCVASARAAGATWAELQTELGVSKQTLIRWFNKGRNGKTAGFVPVRLASSREGQTVTLVSPGGWRLEGADVETVLAILRALSK